MDSGGSSLSLSHGDVLSGASRPYLACPCAPGTLSSLLLWGRAALLSDCSSGAVFWRASDFSSCFLKLGWGLVFP